MHQLQRVCLYTGSPGTWKKCYHDCTLVKRQVQVILEAGDEHCAIIRHQIELPFESHASDQPRRHFGEGVNKNHDATPAGMMPLQMNLLPSKLSPGSESTQGHHSVAVHSGLQWSEYLLIGDATTRKGC